MPVLKSAFAGLILCASVDASLYELTVTGVVTHGNFMEDYGVSLGDEFRAQVVYNDHPAFDWWPSPDHGEYPLRSAVASVGSTSADTLDDVFPSTIEVSRSPSRGWLRLDIDFLPIIQDGMFRDWFSLWIELPTFPGIELVNDRPPSIVEPGTWDYSTSFFSFDEVWVDGYEGLDLQFAYGPVTAIAVRPIPEPTAAAFLAFGVAAASCRSRRQNRGF